MALIILVLSIYLDGLFSLQSTSSYFLPALTITTLYLIYPLYKKKFSFNLILVLSGVTYDLLYTNLLFFTAIVFLILGKLIQVIYNNYHQNIMYIIFYITVLIIAYEVLIAGIFLTFQTANISLLTLALKILRTLPLNIIYVLILFPLLKKSYLL